MNLLSYQRKQMEQEPIFEFYRCFDCKKIVEVKKLTKDISCSCGGRRFRPTHLSFIQLWFYILTHPSCIKEIIRNLHG